MALRQRLLWLIEKESGSFGLVAVVPTAHCLHLEQSLVGICYYKVLSYRLGGRKS